MKVYKSNRFLREYIKIWDTLFVLERVNSSMITYTLRDEYLMARGLFMDESI